MGGPGLRAAGAPSAALAAFATPRPAPLKAASLVRGRTPRSTQPRSRCSGVGVAMSAASLAAPAPFAGLLEPPAGPTSAGSAAAAAGRRVLSARPAPSQRNESWRQTDLAPLSGLVAVPPPSVSEPGVSELAAGLACSLHPTPTGGARAVLVDGRLCRVDVDWKLPQAEASVRSLSEAAEALPLEPGSALGARGGFFAALAAARCAEGLAIHVGPGVELPGEILVVHARTRASSGDEGRGEGVGATASLQPAFLFAVLEEGARARLREAAVSAVWDGSRLTVEGGVADEARAGAPSASGGAEAGGAAGEGAGAPSRAGRAGARKALSLASSARELALDDGATMEHVMAFTGAPRHAATVDSTLVEQGRGSSYRLVELRSGGLLTRHEVDVAQAGEATTTTLRHLQLAGPGELHDVHTSLDLRHPAGRADQVHKCIAADRGSRVVFDGAVAVGKLAQGTDAAQLTRSLLLARGASVHARPNLVIVADDVRCTHGASVADLDEEALFYLRARGVDPGRARASLVAAFAGEILREVGDPAVEAAAAADIAAALSASSRARDPASAADLGRGSGGKGGRAAA